MVKLCPHLLHRSSCLQLSTHYHVATSYNLPKHSFHLSSQRTQRIAVKTCCGTANKMALKQGQVAVPPSDTLKAEFRQFLATNPTLVLGTQSSSRRAIMDAMVAEYGFQYTCQVAGIDEDAIRDPEPSQLVLMLARAKAEAILHKLEQQTPPDAKLLPGDSAARQTYLITCDQVVLYDGAIREKPADLQQAREWIDSYQHLPACTCGSTRVVNIGTGASSEAVDYTETYFNAIPDASVDELLKEGEVMWCSGALMVEHSLVAPHLIRLEGTQDAVMGLSMQTVMRLLVQIWRQAA